MLDSKNRINKVMMSVEPFFLEEIFFYNSCKIIPVVGMYVITKAYCELHGRWQFGV